MSVFRQPLYRFVFGNCNNHFCLAKDKYYVYRQLPALSTTVPSPVTGLFACYSRSSFKQANLQLRFDCPQQQLMGLESPLRNGAELVFVFLECFRE